MCGQGSTFSLNSFPIVNHSGQPCINTIHMYVCMYVPTKQHRVPVHYAKWMMCGQGSTFSLNSCPIVNHSGQPCINHSHVSIYLPTKQHYLPTYLPTQIVTTTYIPYLWQSLTYIARVNYVVHEVEVGGFTRSIHNRVIMGFWWMVWWWVPGHIIPWGGPIGVPIEEPYKP